jgi:hypothetical protein
MEIKKLMDRHASVRLLIVVIALTGLFLSSCYDDKRLTEMAQEAANRQTEQNKEMAQQNQRIAEATKELVQADAQARPSLMPYLRKGGFVFSYLHRFLEFRKNV